MKINLLQTINSDLPGELVRLIKQLAFIARDRGERLYLAGGVVRDLLLKRPTCDLDLVVEGDAAALVAQLALPQASITVHDRFGTARWQWDNWTIDIAAARAETYAHPGALPTVRPSNINGDLARRDFTINAMAASINEDDFGNLIDLHGGRRDLEAGVIRVLHDNSFIEDATRIWRALRYEQRLDFNIEPKTLSLLTRDIPMLDTITGDRIRYELECVLKEKQPEKVLRRADQLNVLARLHPALKGDDRLAETFSRARQLDEPSPVLYFSLLFYRLSREQINSVIAYLGFDKNTATALRQTAELKEKMRLLESAMLSPSQVYFLLHGYHTAALQAASLATNSVVARRHLDAYQSKLRYVKTSLNGDNLLAMGIAPGPEMKEILNRLLAAKLDGEIKTRADELAYLVKAGYRKSS